MQANLVQEKSRRSRSLVAYRDTLGDKADRIGACLFSVVLSFTPIGKQVDGLAETFLLPGHNSRHARSAVSPRPGPRTRTLSAALRGALFYTSYCDIMTERSGCRKAAQWRSRTSCVSSMSAWTACLISKR